VVVVSPRWSKLTVIGKLLLAAIITPELLRSTLIVSPLSIVPFWFRSSV